MDLQAVFPEYRPCGRFCESEAVPKQRNADRPVMVGEEP